MNITKRNFVFAISQLKFIETGKFLSLPYIIIMVLCGVGTRIFKFRCFMSCQIAREKNLLTKLVSFCSPFRWPLNYLQIQGIIKQVVQHQINYKCWVSTRKLDQWRNIRRLSVNIVKGILIQIWKSLNIVTNMFLFAIIPIFILL